MLTVRKKNMIDNYKETMENLVPDVPVLLEQVIIVSYPNDVSINIHALSFWNQKTKHGAKPSASADQSKVTPKIPSSNSFQPI